MWYGSVKGLDLHTETRTLSYQLNGNISLPGTGPRSLAIPRRAAVKHRATGPWRVRQRNFRQVQGSVHREIRMLPRKQVLAGTGPARASASGTSLADQSMVPFQKAYPMTLTMVVLILAGNTAFVRNLFNQLVLLTDL